MSSDIDKLILRAKNNAYALLRVRPRSETEIVDRLKRKGYGNSVVKPVVDDLKRLGQIDDEKFARFWIDSRLHLNPKGEVVLRHELKEKGVSDAVIEATLASKDLKRDEYEVAKVMAAERMKRLEKIDKRKALKRIYDFLIRRGFRYDVIRKIIEEL